MSRREVWVCRFLLTPSASLSHLASQKDCRVSIAIDGSCAPSNPVLDLPARLLVKATGGGCVNGIGRRILTIQLRWNLNREVIWTSKLSFRRNAKQLILAWPYIPIAEDVAGWAPACPRPAGRRRIPLHGEASRLESLDPHVC